ncbi:hypothetical protein RHMOL_Rhmol05G0126900 [Rhododendron molle]|uniref:Uncharacterized protein n=1 Tax=Rhododendron molle TaxID=49168 RepID=A0ACC0NPK2_RHOML|nr:hypothetical protein RHMOL_Rhmol05G0126900 [Rhododendron molle]
MLRIDEVPPPERWKIVGEAEVVETLLEIPGLILVFLLLLLLFLLLFWCQLGFIGGVRIWGGGKRGGVRLKCDDWDEERDRRRKRIRERRRRVVVVDSDLAMDSQRTPLGMVGMRSEE